MSAGGARSGAGARSLASPPAGGTAGGTAGTATSREQRWPGLARRAGAPTPPRLTPSRPPSPLCRSALDLVPFGIKPLLRRAAAYEALERYPQAYVDYKTVLQVDCSVQAAHDGVNR